MSAHQEAYCRACETNLDAGDAYDAATVDLGLCDHCWAAHLRAENARLRKALEVYADLSCWKHDGNKPPFDRSSCLGPTLASRALANVERTTP